MNKQIPLAILSALVLALFMGCASAPRTTGASAGGSDAAITDIKVQDNTVIITASKDFTYTLYKGNDPYKVTIDIPDISIGSMGKIVSDKAGVSEVTPMPSSDGKAMAKIEITLQNPSSVVPSYKDNSLTLMIKPEEQAVASKAETPQVAPAADPPAPAGNPGTPSAASNAEPAATHEHPKSSEAPLGRATVVTRVELERADGGVKVLITGNGLLMPNVFPLDGRIVVDIPDVVMTASIPKTMMAPLKSMRAGKHKEKVRLVLDLTERAKFDVAAVGSTIEVSLMKRGSAMRTAAAAAPAAVADKAVTTDVSKDTGGSAAAEAVKRPDNSVAQTNGRSGGSKCTGNAPISLDFQEADVGPIFRLLADVNGCNLVLDPAVRGKITIKLMNVPWEQAARIVSRQSNLGYRIDENIMYVAPTGVFEKLATDQAKLQRAQEDAEPMVQEIIRVNYAGAGDISAAVTSGKLLSSRGNITIDGRMNTLIVKDTQKSVDRIRDLVKVMDVSKPQVMIEARIVQVSNSYSQTLGIRWGGTATPPSFPTTVSSNFSVNTPPTGAGSGVTNPGGVLGLSIGYANTFKVDMSLQALESVQKAKTLSNPKVLTMDNEAATIQQGQTFFISTVSQAGTQTQQQSATLSLNVTPKITPDGYVQLKVTATDNSLASVSPPVVDTKSLTTQALVKDGETLVLGGIYKSSKVEDETGVPMLSRIPVLGWLFKTKNQTGPDIVELLIFITPTIVSQPSATSAL